MRMVKRVSVGVVKFGFGFEFYVDFWGGDCYWESDVSFFFVGLVVY